MNSTITILVGIILLAIIIIIWAIVEYNKFIQLLKKVEQSKSGIDVYLKQRFDLIPNLVEVAKGYAKHEEKVLQEITKLIQSFDSNNNKDLDVNAELNNQFNKLLAVVEAYPELKANENFLKLQEQLAKIESQLRAARRIYNSDVTEYNTKVHTVPSNLIAKRYKFEDKKLFEITNYEKNNVNIKI